VTTRILVIEDEPDILELYRLLLEAEGYKVYTKDTTYTDLTEVKRIQPHLIILDLLIGLRQDGWRFFDMVRQTASTASIPFILCTAAEHELKGKVDALEAPFVDIVFKPFDVDDFLQVVKRMLALAPLEMP
jgi:two-component system, OmpR family, response regulator VicR